MRDLDNPDHAKVHLSADDLRVDLFSTSEDSSVIGDPGVRWIITLKNLPEGHRQLFRYGHEHKMPRGDYPNYEVSAEHPLVHMGFTPWLREGPMDERPQKTVERARYDAHRWVELFVNREMTIDLMRAEIEQTTSRYVGEEKSERYG